MYTQTGKNHLNLHTAGKVQEVATHIVIGIDHLNTTGDALPLLTDRYLGAFQSATIPIINTTLVEQDIVFASSYDSAPVGMCLGNVMGLVYENVANDNRYRIRRNVFGDFTNWTGDVELTTANTPTAWPSPEGGMIVGPGTTVANVANFDLKQYQGDDVLAIPVFFVGSAPTGGVLTFKFTYKDAGVDTTYSLSDTVESIDAGLHFRFTGGVPALDDVGVLITTYLNQPKPTVWQRKLNSGTTPASFLANLDKINKVELTWTGASQLYVGSPQITPDFDADTASIVVAYGKLSTVAVHPGQTYLAAEYRIRGII